MDVSDKVVALVHALYGVYRTAFSWMTESGVYLGDIGR
jgi:hypothetical protein